MTDIPPYRCRDCLGTGFKSARALTWPEHTGTTCHCPAGAERRKQSNLETILASRLHTDLHDERSESISANGPFPDDDLTHESLAQRLTRTAYRAPVIRPIPHTCYSCGVNAVSTCATLCKGCAEAQTVAIKKEEKADSDILMGALFVFLLGGFTVYLFLKMTGALP